MGNPAIFYPGDGPRPCWTCEHFDGLHTSRLGWLFVNCTERGRFTQADPDEGCRFWTSVAHEAEPNGAKR